MFFFIFVLCSCCQDRVTTFPTLRSKAQNLQMNPIQKENVMLHKKSEKGQALVLIVFALIGLLGMTALTVDGGIAYLDRNNAQTAADSAAIAAGLANSHGQNVTNAALDRAASNNFNNDGTRNIVTVTITPTTTGVCPETGKIIKVDITSNAPTTFAKLLGKSQVTNRVSASTKACDVSGTAGSPLYTGSAVYATKTAACGNGTNDKALSTNGSSQVQMWGGGFGSASTDGDCVDFSGGNVQLKKQESGTACADIYMASASGTGQDFSHVYGQDGCGQPHYNVAFPAPPANLNITCAGNATKTGSTLSQGNYTGTFPPSGVTTLQSGTYCVNGDFDMNGGDNLHGDGVMIVLNTGGIKWNGNMTLDLSGPTSGSYKGLVIYLPPTNSSQIRLNGSSGVKLAGTMLAQNAPCDFSGTGKIEKNAWNFQMICYTWQMTGNYDAQIMYNSSLLYSPATTVLPSVELLQ
jgi:Flp pilus assembly protein TadG